MVVVLRHLDCILASSALIFLFSTKGVSNRIQPARALRSVGGMEILEQRCRLQGRIIHQLSDGCLIPAPVCRDRVHTLIQISVYIGIRPP